MGVAERDGEDGDQPCRPGRAAGQGDAHRQHDQAAARGGPRRPAGRGQPARLTEIHRRSIIELEDGLAPELLDELERLSLPFTDDDARPRPSCGSPRPSWSAGSRGSSTASRRRCSPSRWRPGRSSSRCAARPAGHRRGYPACRYPAARSQVSPVTAPTAPASTSDRPAP